MFDLPAALQVPCPNCERPIHVGFHVDQTWHREPKNGIPTTTMITPSGSHICEAPQLLAAASA